MVVFPPPSMRKATQMDLTDVTLNQLYDVHTSLCTAHTEMHKAWRVLQASDTNAATELWRLQMELSARITEVGKRIDVLYAERAATIDIPLADDTIPAAKPAAPIVTNWDQTEHGYFFELDKGETGYVRRRDDGTYTHYTPGFIKITPVEAIASAREVAVAAYMAEHRIGS